ncbi:MULTISPECIES: hypothetical protein [Acidiphilium]|uniref:hypothetical protein n=1 Tax=Acidiphilium TaxID=522 RepID=UPI0025890093|nr:MULTISPECIES: hypothetical protein [Acidiphilium]HQT86696.1 hypothetical protein [Acidiphilium rubrum]
MSSGLRAISIADFLLRASDPANQRIVGDAAREAVASLRGYAYQIYASALAWLDLPPGSEMHLEVAEDFAVAAADSLDAVQVKDMQGTISLASKQARDAISAFVKLTNDNPARAVRLTLMTTASVTTERNLEHRTGDVPGIERWRAAAKGGDLGNLRDVLLHLALDADALAFVRERDDERLRRELLRRIEWRCGEGDIGDLAARFEDRVAEVCLEDYGVPWAESPRYAAIILLEVLRVCSRSGSRACTHQELRNLLSQSTHVSTPRRDYDAMVAALVGAPRGSAVGLAATGGWESEEDIPLPANLIPRAALVERAGSALRAASFGLLHGGSGMGKTALARLAARAVGGRWNVLDLRYRSQEEAGEQLLRYARRPRDGRQGLIADDVPDMHALEEGSRLVRAIGMVVERGDLLILTSYRPPTAGGRLALGISETAVIDVPLLAVDEIEEIVLRAGGDGNWVAAVWLASRAGHPQLARALVVGLQGRGWPEDERDRLLTEGAPEISEQLEATRRRLIRAVPDEPGRSLLHRLGLLAGRFPRKVAIALGAIEPAAQLPGERFDALVGPWIDRVGSDRYRASPLVAGSGDDVLSPAEIKAAHRAIAEALVATGKIDVDQIDNILVHGRAGAATWPLMAIAQLVLTTERETLAKVAPFAPRLRAADTSRPLLPTNPHLGLMLRLAQACLTAARNFGPEAGRAARALIAELDAFDGEGKSMLETVGFGKLLFERGFSSAVPEWPDLLRRFVQVSAQEVPSLESAEVRDLIGDRPLGPTLLAFGLSTLGTVAQIVDAFGRLSAMGEGRARLLGPMDGIVTPTTVMMSPWLKERNRGSADPRRAAADYVRLAEMAKSWGQRDWAVASFFGAAAVHHQDLRDAAATLALLDRATAELGQDKWFDRIRQKVLWTERRDAEAIPIVRVLRETFRGNSIEMSDILREGAISASRLGEHALAAEWFGAAEAAAAGVQLSSYRALGIGMAADAAAELWRSGDRMSALGALADVLDRLRNLDPGENLQAEYVHRVVRHSLLWFADAAGMGNIQVAGDAPALPPGACSNPEPRKEILDIVLVPLDVAHYFLAQIAHAAGIADVVPDPRTRLSGEPILVLEVSLRKDLLDRAILDGNAAAFLDSLPAAFAGLLAMPRLRESGARFALPDWERGELPSINPNDPQFTTFIRDAVLSFRLHAGATGRPGAGEALRTLLAERGGPGGESVLSLMFPESGTAGSRSPEACLDLIGRSDLTPNDLLECCLRLGQRLERSEFRKAVSPSFVRWAKREWLTIAEQCRFLLRSPSLTAPDIIAAAQAEGEDVSDLARVLAAAIYGVSIAVPEDFRRWIRERSGLR